MYRKNNFQKFSEMVPLACWAYRTLWTSILFLVQQTQQVDVFTGEKKKKSYCTPVVFTERERGEGRERGSQWRLRNIFHISLNSVWRACIDFLSTDTGESGGETLPLPAHQTSQTVHSGVWPVPAPCTERPGWWSPRCLQTGCCQNRRRRKKE